MTVFQRKYRRFKENVRRIVKFEIITGNFWSFLIYGSVEMLEGHSADTCGGKFQLVSMGTERRVSRAQTVNTIFLAAYLRLMHEFSNFKI